MIDSANLGRDTQTPARRFGTYYRTTCVANWRWRDGRLARPSIAAKMRADQFLTSENCIRKRLLENVPPAIPTSNVLGSFDFAQDDCFGGVTLVVKVDYDGLRD